MMGWAELDGITTSNTPQFAPENYATLEPVVALKCAYESQYTGSGVELKEHPLKDECVNIISDHNVCRHCNGKNTRIIFFSYFGDLVGKTSRVEIACNDCHSYTQFYYGD